MGFVTPEPRRALPGVPFIRAPIPFKRTPPSRPNHLPSLHLLTPAHQALRFQRMNWGGGGGDTNTQTTLASRGVQIPCDDGTPGSSCFMDASRAGDCRASEKPIPGIKATAQRCLGEPRLEPDAQKTPPPPPPQAEEGWVGRGVKQDTEGELKHLPKGVSCMRVYAGAFT